MSYRIDYQGPKKVRGAEKRRLGLPALIGLCFLLIIGAWAVWPEGAAVLKELLIPGDNAVTVGALEEMAAGLGAGESLCAAFSGFCRQVMGIGGA